MQFPCSWSTCRLLVVDPSAALPVALHAALGAAPGIELLAATPAGALAANMPPPDAALYVAPPNGTFLGPISAWTARVGPLPFIIYDPTPTMLRHSCVLSSGAGGYVTNTVSVDELRGALWFASQGGYASCVQSTQLMRERLQVPASFSDREGLITTLVALGATNNDIAAELGVSIRTVEDSINKLFKKTGATTRAALVAWATLWSITGDDDDAVVVEQAALDTFELLAADEQRPIPVPPPALSGRGSRIPASSQDGRG